MKQLRGLYAQTFFTSRTVLAHASQKQTVIDQQQHSCETLICRRHQTILRLLSSAATASTRWRVRELYCQPTYSLLLSMLYMFRTVSPPIIRSSRTIHIASGTCQACLLLSLAWLSWIWFVKLIYVFDRHLLLPFFDSFVSITNLVQ